MAERHTVDVALKHGAYGVTATQHTVDVLLRVRNPLGSLILFGRILQLFL